MKSVFMKFAVIMTSVMMLMSCAKIGDFSVSKTSDNDIFEAIELNMVPDGYWLAHPLRAYVLDNKANIVQEREVEGLASPANLYTVHCWKNGVLIKILSHYELPERFLNEGDPQDFVFTTETTGTEPFVVDAKTREGHYSPLTGKDFLVTELTASAFAYIWKWTDDWGYNRYTKIDDAAYLELLETCPNNDRTVMDSILNRQ